MRRIVYIAATNEIGGADASLFELVSIALPPSSPVKVALPESNARYEEVLVT